MRTKKRSSSTALSQALGELELEVLDLLWQTPDTDAKAIRARLADNRMPSLSTVQSTLERLWKKGYLRRAKHSHAYLYEAKVSRADLLGRFMSEAISVLHDGTVDTILSSFVNAAVNLDENSLNHLEALIAKKKRDQNGGENA